MEEQHLLDAVEAARSLQEALPSLFDSAPISVRDVAGALGIQIVRSPSLSDRGSLRIDQDVQGRTRRRIFLPSKLATDYSRFAAAHEIGHLMLFEKMPDLARKLNATKTEAFCHRFAAALLVPHCIESEVSRRIAEANLPSDFVRLCAFVGVSISAMFAIISGIGRTWLGGANTAFFLVRFRAHPNPSSSARSSSAPRWRVASAIFDENCCYFPTNQGLSSLISPSEWMLALNDGDEERALLCVRSSKVVGLAGEHRKYRRVSEIAPVSVMRLRPILGTSASSFLMVVKVGRPDI